MPQLLQKQQRQRDSRHPGALQRRSDVAGPRNRHLQVGLLPLAGIHATNLHWNGLDFTQGPHVMPDQSEAQTLELMSF